MKGDLIVNRLISLALAFCVLLLFLKGCNIKEDSMITTNGNNIANEKEEVLKEYLKLVNNEKDELISIFNWLNDKSGYFNMSIDNGEPIIDTNKGEEYRANNKSIKNLVALMNKYKLDCLLQDDSGADVMMMRITNTDGNFNMHKLIYDKGKLSPEAQREYVKVEDDFYYWYSTGE
jgi:hypothetical protein